jgi:hypothetical protein
MFSDELDKIYRPQHPPAHRPMRVKAFFHHRFHRFEPATPPKNFAAGTVGPDGPEEVLEPGISAGWKFLYPSRRSFFPAPGTAVFPPFHAEEPLQTKPDRKDIFFRAWTLVPSFRGGIL